MAILKTEIYQDVAYALDDTGRIWQLRVDSYQQPIIQEVDRFERWQIEAEMRPHLARSFYGR